MAEAKAYKMIPHYTKDTITYEMDELIRCKDCENSKHWYGDRRRCFLWHESGIAVFDDGFCNYGKRKKVRTKTEKT